MANAPVSVVKMPKGEATVSVVSPFVLRRSGALYAYLEWVYMIDSSFDVALTGNFRFVSKHCFSSDSTDGSNEDAEGVCW